MLSEWCEGDENSFPVHLALLTRAQWRAAARIPPLINDSVKLMELKLAEYRQQTAALVKDFARTSDAKAKNLENIVATHTSALNQTVAKVQAQLNNAETIAEQIKSQLEAGVIDWKKASTRRDGIWFMGGPCRFPSRAAGRLCALPARRSVQPQQPPSHLSHASKPF